MAIGPVVLDLLGPVLSIEEKQLLAHPAVGGVILFSRNIESYQQLQQLIASIRDVRQELLICVDQEGGRVHRCREGFTRIPPMQVFDRLYAENETDALALARNCGWLLASELLAVDIDFSFAPVLDVDKEFCSVIGDRSFSSDPDRVFSLGQAFIAGFKEAGMAVTGKHFPGHGSVRGDSHLELPIDGRSWQEIQQHDLVPFSKLCQQLDAVMPAHILFPQVDDQAPVGFSSFWLNHILRQQMGYKGVIFSDDLSMIGATSVGDYTARARLALGAGCDMVLVCNNRPGAIEVLQNLSADQYYSGLGERVLMRARKRVSPSQLKQEKRWQQTVQRLAELVPQS